MILVQVYGRRLTALILDSAHSHQEDDNDHDDDDDVKSSQGTVPFGDSGQARLFRVKCHKHKA